VIRSRSRPRRQAFDAERFLHSVGRSRRVVAYAPSQVIFTQGEPCLSVLYVLSGAVKLSVLSPSGKEAVVAMFGPGDFFGEGCLAGQPVRIATASAVTASTILVVQKAAMIKLLHSQRAFSDRFITHMLAINIRVEEDLVDQLFNSSEKRLARTLLLLARYGKKNAPGWVLPKISQTALAEMVGTTRSRVNFFMNKFKKLGFVEYNGSLKINPSLVTVVVHPE